MSHSDAVVPCTGRITPRGRQALVAERQRLTDLVAACAVLTQPTIETKSVLLPAGGSAKLIKRP